MPSEDIKNLFSRFGSRSGRYHEIVREDQRADSVGRWPLLSSVQVGEVRDIPGVNMRMPEPEPLPRALTPVAQAPMAQPAPAAQPTGLLSHLAAQPVIAASASSQAPRKPMFSWAHEADKAAVPPAPKQEFAAAPIPLATPIQALAPSAAQLSRRAPEPVVSRELPTAPAKPWLAVPAANSGVAAQSPKIPVAMPDRSLQGVFGRLGGAAEEPQASAVDPRSLPAFRRLRRS